MREENKKKKTMSDSRKSVRRVSYTTIVYAIPLHPRNIKYRDSVNNATAVKNNFYCLQTRARRDRTTRHVPHPTSIVRLAPATS
jgi:hypothetical protein